VVAAEAEAAEVPTDETPAAEVATVEGRQEGER
jgi:hypothetical protein